ncbi:MAG: hypothetical protein VX589_21475 [Myxococcota bacterium]|nr:hypothetical protein [Myxococcota bacterium]
MPRLYPMQGNAQQFVGIPTSAEFIQLTTIEGVFRRHRRKNIRLLACDRALAEFEAHGAIPYAGPGVEPAEVTEGYHYITKILLLKVAIRAQIWIESKAGLKSTRRPTVVCLLQQCIVHLARAPLYAFGQPASTGDVTAARLKGFLARARIARMKTQLAAVGVGGPGKALDSDYWLETNFHGLNPDHHMGQGERLAFRAGQSNFVMHQVRGPGGGHAGSEIAYIDAAGRDRYKLHFINGGVHRQIDHAHPPELVENINGKILIMDLAGHFYSTFGDAAPGGKAWHHSSMLAGQPVGFAGGIVVQDGVITELDNMSGHYKPSPKYMVAALTQLSTLGVDLDDVRITLAFPVPNDPDMMRIQMFNSGSKYLRLKGFLRPDVDTAPEHDM